jgi:NDP-sugar pyrophosphorylase family protein
MYKVLITTSGTGSRLMDLTKTTNKSLILLKRKPIIDYIVDLYPKNIEIVVTLGYYGDKVKKHLLEKYPNRKFTFVQIDRYEGVGSSLGYSMLQAGDVLQCPFVFHCNDTIIVGQKIPSPEKFNWNGGSRGLDKEIFNTKFLSSFTVKNGFMRVMNRKGAEVWNLFHIGLVGFKDYKGFWKALKIRFRENPSDSSLNDCSAMQVMVDKGIKFKAIEFKKWYDTGNLIDLDFAKKNI